jgi:uncharacterized membrane protein YfcA
MQALIVLGLVGFGAQLVNSSLGMGYGVTSTSALLSIGAAPAVASATVNFSQVGSQLVSGYAHWRFGNVDWGIVRRIAVPGAAGAFGGALFLSWLAVDVARPFMAAILLGLGTYLLIRFTVWGTPRGSLGQRVRTRVLTPVGLLGGFMNSTGGGGWGPIGTTALLATGRLAPRMVVGSISAAEFAVVSAGSAGFIFGLGLGGVNLHWVVVMLVGGVLAAPVAAWLARHVPGRMLGSLIGGLIVVLNLRNLLYGGGPAEAPAAAPAVVAVAVLVWIGAVGYSARAYLQARRPVKIGAAPHS